MKLKIPLSCYAHPMSGRRQDLRQELMRLAFSQAGYFAAAQAVDIGYTYQAQKYHVDHGNWVRVDRGLFRLPHWQPGPEDAFVRWTLWSGGRGVVSHESALAVHELSDVDPARIHLTVGEDFHARDDAVVLHYGSPSEDEVEPRMGWSVTTPIRTLLDVGASDLSQEHVDAAVRDALEKGLITRRRMLRATDGADPRAALRVERALVSAGEAE